MNTTDSSRMEELSFHQCRAWLDILPARRIAVVGDVMLDHYYLGSVTRISPEAPVPVVELEQETYRLGGAANVAHNLRMLGADVLLCGVIGQDAHGATLVQLAEELGIRTEGIIADASRPTTVKTRVIGNSQQLLRLDRETRVPIADSVAKQLLSALESSTDIAALIVEDYNKGVLRADVIAALGQWAHRRNIPLLVDPKMENFFAYHGATVFKPNQKEAQAALGMKLEHEGDIVEAGHMLLQRLAAENVLITLGNRGMMLIERSGKHWHIPSVARHVADVSGAGDTVIATVAAFMAVGATVRQAAQLATIAAGIVCGEPGVVPITIPALLAALEHAPHDAPSLVTPFLQRL
ncbi:MAG: D-glycero-beta-D-manno-heptose-7-phosphate kinase [Bacteroidota bacterium]|nr:D-glycero-beta-D-manno-heptose-7-phosphate kinase [Candidatus Kapabacteria bacterium]MCS7302927.1 D-glycero-beta-D-manno-heptose-7-phosphate kinase [Candidatus Kapabacteria bacterium]MCX7937432.1 D-glycero-beta-D-manno-heptose-7-phosphate kinase [Chlorobiota bacterium]MDW8075792.1 D-glycero-beta-D-manno-heptose-7-phosphate kinase [Bacteroidota bacterium]MDW8272471.1 D-glycero-beta-D-manno-heptose-7-phosphate kinase [Bacteroidota bacterium]